MADFLLLICLPMQQHMQSTAFSFYIVYMQMTKAYDYVLRVVLVLSTYSITLLSHDFFHVRLTQ